MILQEQTEFLHNFLNLLCSFQFCAVNMQHTECGAAMGHLSINLTWPSRRRNAWNRKNCYRNMTWSYSDTELRSSSKIAKKCIKQGNKSIFNKDFIKNSKVFWKLSNVCGFFSQTRKILQACFLNSLFDWKYSSNVTCAVFFHKLNPLSGNFARVFIPFKNFLLNLRGFCWGF